MRNRQLYIATGMVAAGVAAAWTAGAHVSSRILAEDISPAALIAAVGNAGLAEALRGSTDDPAGVLADPKKLIEILEAQIPVE